MLVADPSSSCDVCFGSFGPDMECYCIPCGHVFCHSCLMNLRTLVCPICRTHLNSRSRIRKIIVDWARPDSEGQHHPVARRIERELEEQLAQEAERGITLRRALELHQKAHDFMKRRPEDEHPVLKSLASVLCDLYETKDQLEDLKKYTTQLEQHNTRLEHQRRMCEHQKSSLEEERQQIFASSHHSGAEIVINCLLDKVKAQKAVIRRLSLPQNGGLVRLNPSTPPPPIKAPMTSPFAPWLNSAQDAPRKIPDRHAHADRKQYWPRSPHDHHDQLHPSSARMQPYYPHILATPPLTPIAPLPALHILSPIPSFPPPPPLPTVYVPEPGRDNVWPYVPTPRLQEMLSRAAEEREARKREEMRGYPSLSYESVYREQMQSKVSGNVPLPRD